jgi:hypothetical protein
MATYIRYKIETGEIDSFGITDTNVLPFDIPNGFASMEGYGVNQTNYVANSAILEYTLQQQVDKANKPSHKCAWSNETFAWNDSRTLEEKTSDATNSAISKRDRLLGESDWVVVRAVDQGKPIPTDWQAYRQELRDITNQTGFPFEVIFPVAPS